MIREYMAALAHNSKEIVVELRKLNENLNDRPDVTTE